MFCTKLHVSGYEVCSQLVSYNFLTLNVLVLQMNSTLFRLEIQGNCSIIQTFTLFSFSSLGDKRKQSNFQELSSGRIHLIQALSSSTFT